MTIERDLTPKTVLYLTDFPLVKEEDTGNPYSEHSSRQLKQALHAASVKEHMVAGLEKFFGVEEANIIKHLDNKQFNDVYKSNLGSKFLPNPAILDDSSICFTYLSMARPKEKDSDWTNSILSKKQLVGDQVPSYAEDFLSKEMVQVSGYIQCTWLKDVWVSPEVWSELQALFTQIRAVQPKLIILAGKWSLLFLTTMLDGSDSQLTTIARTKTTFKRKLFFGDLNKYRASLLTTFSQLELPKTVVLPILNPAFHWISPDKERIYQKDYLKVAGLHRKLTNGNAVEELLTSKQTLTIAETKEQALALLTELLEVLQSKPTKVAIDVETRSKTIDCIGFAYKDNEGFTVPFTYQHTYVNDVEETVWYKDRWEVVPAGQSITVDRNYWTLEEETEILYLLQKAMLHPNCLHVGQNYMYDVSMYYKDWKLVINATEDTMIQHHVLFNYMQKDLGLLASMYIDNFTHWKGEIGGDNETRWKYNVKDCIYTLGINKILSAILAREVPSLQQFYVFQQAEVCKFASTLMNRGVPIDLQLKETLKVEFTELQRHARELLQWQVGDAEFNPDSTQQIKILFKEICGITPVIDKKTKAETFGAKAMLVYLEEYPQYRPLLSLYLEYKKLGVFIRNFLNAKISPEGILYFWLKVAGTSTYRMACTKLPDGSGMNIQQLPSGARGGFKLSVCLQDYRADSSEDSLEDIIEDGTEEAEVRSTIDLGANFGRVKDLLIPPEGYYFYDIDYSAIDLHFVVYTADCKWAKYILVVKGDCVYRVMAEEYYGYLVTKKMEERQTFKAIIHGKDYRGGAVTLAAQAGLSVPKVMEILRIYDTKCPEIERQLLKQEDQVMRLGYVNSSFGARLWIPDIKDNMWKNKAAAAPPQSSAGTLVNKGIARLEKGENPTKFNRFAVYDESGRFKEWSYSFEPVVKKGGSIQTLLQVHDSAPGIFRKDDVTAIRRIIDYFTIPLEINGDIMTIPVDVKVSDKSYGDCNSELAKELLAKADAWIAGQG